MDAERRGEALALAEQTLAELEMGSGRLTPVVLKCLRLARLTENTDAGTWFRLELQGYRASVNANWAQFAAFSGREAPTPQPPGGVDVKKMLRQLTDRTDGDVTDDEHAEDKLLPPAAAQQYWWTNPIEEIEAIIVELQEELRALTIPSALPETSANYEPHRYYPGLTDAEKVLNPILTRRSTAAAELRKWTHIGAALRGALQEWLTRSRCRDAVRNHDGDRVRRGAPSRRRALEYECARCRKIADCRIRAGAID